MSSQEDVFETDMIEETKRICLNQLRVAALPQSVPSCAVGLRKPIVRPGRAGLQRFR